MDFSSLDIFYPIIYIITIPPLSNKYLFLMIHMKGIIFIKTNKYSTKLR